MKHLILLWQSFTIRTLVTRRAFVRRTSLLLASIGILGGCGADSPTDPAQKPNSKPDDSYPWKLSKDQRDVIQAIAEVMIPKDEDPGAEAVDVARQVNDDILQKRLDLEFIKAGTTYLETVVTKMYPEKKGFLHLNPDQKIYILHTFFDRDDEEGLVTRYDQPELLYKFFLQIFNDTRAAFYCSEAGAQVMGYTPPIQGYPKHIEAPRQRQKRK